MIAPFPPTPCRVWLDRDGTPAVDDDKELLVEVIERAYPSAALATLVPRAQWEAVLDLWSALRDYERSLAQGDTPEHDDIAKRFYDAQDHLATFFPEAA